jgi:two-component system, response regulator YesN
MFNVLIVEDELPVRDTIISSIDWEKLGFQVVFAADDGQEALEFLENASVDLILTDIYMPFVDGLEFVRRLRKKNNYTKVVFLTGYNEFEFAKEAIELEASRYLLKPITKEELIHVLIELQKEIEEEINQKKNIQWLKVEYDKKLVDIRDQWLRDIMAGYVPKETVEKTLAVNYPSLIAKGYAIGILEIVNKEEVGNSLWKQDYSLLHFAVYNICNEILSNEHLVIIGEQGKILCLLQGVLEKETYARGLNLLEEAIGMVKHIYTMDMSVGLGSVYEDISSSVYSYREAKLALEYRILEGTNRVIIYSDMERNNGKDFSQTEECMSHIETAIRVGDLERVEKYLDLFFNSLKFKKATINLFKTYTLTLVTKIYGSYNQNVLSDQDQFAIESSIIEKILQSQRIEEINEIINHLCHEMSKEIKRLRDDDQRSIVQQAKKFIEDYYHEPKLDLNRISEQLHVSSSYFARLFKKHYHMTFLDYLTQHRLEVAKNLLKNTTLKVFEIAERIGYEDPHYFSYNFRKNVGMTPLQFRKE